jgi:hypothetical protein
MRSLSQILSAVLLALCWSDLALAEPPDASQPLDPAVLATVTDMQLDSAFEKFVSRDKEHSLYALTGPTTMDCRNAPTVNDPETCVVTGSDLIAPPTALAQH